MVNYQNSKIYKIINEHYEIIYIGSTAEKYLSTRYAKHKLKSPNHKIILIENYACNSREELCMREQEVIEEHNNLLNKIRAYNSEEYIKEYNIKNNKKYRKNNKDKIIEYQQDYYENKKDILLENNKNYRKNNKDYLNQKKKEYNEINKEHIKEYKKNYYENNKSEILKNQNEKVICNFCDCISLKINLKRHQKSKKCLIIQNDKDLKKNKVK